MRALESNFFLEHKFTVFIQYPILTIIAYAALNYYYRRVQNYLLKSIYTAHIWSRILEKIGYIVKKNFMKNVLQAA